MSGAGDSGMWMATFGIAAAATTVAVLVSRRGGEGVKKPPPDFDAFKKIYLVVYCMMVAGDWLQGPYIYALYDAYGFAQHDIAVLFVAGFGSSFVLGTYIGSLADRYGRKRWALLYVGTYVLSCVTKHFNDYWVLMVGRILGGVSTSLLFSVFESWMIKDFTNRNFDESLLGSIFSTQMFLNSIVAILSGVVGQLVASIYPMTALAGPFTMGGFCTPFDCAIICLLVGGVIIDKRWTENYGESEGSGTTEAGLMSGLSVCFGSFAVLLTGVCQSLFEGSMYTFVFMWTPALTPDHDNQPPYGLIFSTMMICAMFGSTLFGFLLKFVKEETLLCIISFFAAAGLCAPIFTQDTFHIYLGFLMFEVCVGLYFPCMGTLKSTIVPEAERSTVYSLFRVPLNAIVVGVLLYNLGVKEAFLWCTCMLFLCGLCAALLVVAPKPRATALDESPLSLLTSKDAADASDEAV